MVSTRSANADPVTLPVGDWRVVAADSELGFETRILFGLIPVRGRYSAYTGELHIDSAGRASGELRIDAATVATGIKKRDRHLRSTDFFAVEEHPHLRFELAALAADADGALMLTGTLHVRDEALPVAAPVSVEQAGPDKLRVDGDFNVDHRASGLRSSGVGWKKVPETLRVKAALTLERAG
jgi:polyisoprenoid-binding protein YceI